MITLHELLKRDDANERERQSPRIDLRGRYSPIGISAVAAACRYGHEYDDRPTPRDLERQRR